VTAMVPLWVDALTALLVVLGGLAALVGSLGLLRLGSFFQRAHAPTLGATLGTWSFALATAVQLSFVREQPFLHALLIPVFIALTAPITTIFLMRAAAFRERGAGSREVPE
jgi:multicomponent K+:H+ antiporter subunit G